MGYREWGKPAPEESPIGEFFLGVFIGTIGIYNGGAWVLASLGWISPRTLLAVCLGLGVFIGLKLAWDSTRRKRIATLKDKEREPYAA